MSGKPNNAYDIVIKVTDDGENNEAGYAYSLDGGNTFSEEMTVPLNGEAVLTNTGLTAKSRKQPEETASRKEIPSAFQRQPRP